MSARAERDALLQQFREAYARGLSAHDEPLFRRFYQLLSTLEPREREEYRAELLTLVPPSLLAAIGVAPFAGVTREHLREHLDEALTRAAKLLKGSAARQHQSNALLMARIAREELKGS